MVAIAATRAPLFLFVGRRRVEHAADSCSCHLHLLLGVSVVFSVLGFSRNDVQSYVAMLGLLFDDGLLGRCPRDHLPERCGLSTLLCEGRLACFRVYREALPSPLG